MRPLCPCLPGAVGEGIRWGLDWLFPPLTPPPRSPPPAFWTSGSAGIRSRSGKAGEEAAGPASGPEKGSLQTGEEGRQEDGVSGHSCPFLPYLLSQLPRFRESGTARGGGAPLQKSSIIGNTLPSGDPGSAGSCSGSSEDWGLLRWTGLASPSEGGVLRSICPPLISALGRPPALSAPHVLKASPLSYVTQTLRKRHIF